MRSLGCTAVLFVAVVVIGCDRDATQMTGPVKSTAAIPHADVAASSVAVPQVSAGSWSSCGLRAAGSILCWGDNSRGQNNPPPGVFVQMNAGYETNCAVTSLGGIVCWGFNSDWKFVVPALPAGLTYRQVSAGFGGACGLRSDGSIVCWGDLAYATPADTYASVAAGDGHICAITTAGVLRCWGTDQAGMVSTAPATPAGRRYTYVAAGSVSSCAILDDGSMQCWGNNQNGQLNVPALPTGVQYTRVAVSTSISDLSQAIFHTCALRSDGTAACWGGNNAGQLNVPALPAGLTYTDITIGGPHTCAARSDGAVLCWGHWLYGQTTPPATLNLLKLPQSIVFNPPVPTDVPRNSTFQVVPNAGTPLVLSSTTPAVCTTEGTTVSFIAAGTCSFNADRPANAEYEAAPTLTTNVTVALTAIQQITFTSTPPSEAHVSDAYTVTATGGGSANPVTFSSLSTSTCTVAGNAVTFVGTGDCVVAADQAAADGYFAAPQVTQTIAVTLRSQTIVFTPPLPAQDTLGAKLTFGATGGTSGNVVTFTVLTPATCAVVSGKLSLTAIGPCTIAADQAGNAAYAAAPRVTASVTVRWSFAFVGLTAAPKPNRGKAGAIVDVPFSLGGDRGLTVLASAPVALLYTCGATPPAVGAGYVQSGTLTYDAKRARYTYAWQTSPGWVKNCVQLTLKLADGTSRVVIFDFR